MRKRIISLLGICTVMAYILQPIMRFDNGCIISFQLPTIHAYAEEVVDSGQCGENGNNVLYSMNEEGTLTIVGSGKMGRWSDPVSAESSEECPPWFSCKSNISKIVIGDGITNISNHAFESCSQLIEISIPSSVTSIGEGAFSDCAKLDSICIPDSVTEIGYNAFEKCLSLTNIIIPNTVTYIGNSAFSDCDGLTEVTIPDSVTYLGADAFSFCDNLTSVLLPDSIKRINGYLFYCCSRLNDITIPDGITSIDSKAFESCRNLTNITIPASVSLINERAFNDCSLLADITIMNPECDIYNAESTISNKNVGSGWTTTYVYNGKIHGYTGSTAEKYAGSHNLTFVSLDDVNTKDHPEEMIASGHCGKNGDNLSYTIDNKGTLFISGNGEMDAWENPDWKPDEGMDPESEEWIQWPDPAPWYRYHTDIKKIILGDGVTTISDYAFANFYELSEISIPNGVISIGKCAFKNCQKLPDVTIPNSVVSIGDYVFDNCCNLTSIVLSNKLTHISEGAFEYCKALKMIDIPDSVTFIYPYAFMECDSLSEIIIPDSVCSIGYEAFMICDNLVKITILNPECDIYDDCDTICNMDAGGNLQSICTIRSYVESTAERYAQKYGHVFESINDDWILPTVTTTTVDTTITVDTTTINEMTTTTASISEMTTTTATINEMATTTASINETTTTTVSPLSGNTDELPQTGMPFSTIILNSPFFFIVVGIILIGKSRKKTNEDEI